MTALLRESVRVAREAVAAGGTDEAEHATRLNNLSIAARDLFESTGDRAALAEAIRAARDSTAGFAPGSPRHAGALLTRIRALATGEVDAAVLAELGECVGGLADTAAPRLRALAYLFLGRAAMSATERQPGTALAAYEQAVAVLPEIAPRRLLRPDREHGLAELAGLPAEAASVALAVGRPDHALVLAEHARGLLLREGMGSRRGLARLTAIDPDLAAEFTRLREQLDAADVDSADRYQPAAPGRAGATERADRHRDLAVRWQQLLDRIRALPGMEGFLRPPVLDELRVDGPVVVVTCSRYRCDAVVVAAGRPIHAVPLDCDYPSLCERAEHFRALDASGAPDEDRIRADLAWLWQRIVQPVLADLRLPSPGVRHDDAPRIWWCPVGVASFLPLHAAGRHDEPGASALDRVVSSYTSTVAALRVDAGTPPTDPTLLAVELGRTPGARPLPGAHAEVRRLAELVPALTRLADADATRDAVLRALPHHRIAHFACHAVTDPQAPALNRLLLHDHASTALTALELSTLTVPDAELAYLSACGTARTGGQLADEAVHIATAFQLAGYRHVVGTLWPVPDKAAARIADDFYTALAPAFRSADSARALHRAVRSIRTDAPDRPSRWAAHIHLGG